MSIKINDQLAPFSHEKGIKALIPGSSWQVTAYPAKIILENIYSKELYFRKEIGLDLKEISSEFTVLLNIEREFINIFGKTKDFYYSYRLIISTGELVLFVDRCGRDGLNFTIDGAEKKLKRKGELIIPINSDIIGTDCVEKVHLGSSKKQDWTLVTRRMNLKEIIPYWFKLGFQSPDSPPFEGGSANYIARCQELLKENDKNNIGQALINCFKCCFQGVFSPRVIDEDYNLRSADNKLDGSPFYILKAGAKIIRNLFIQTNKNGIKILPCLPTEIHSGRAIGLLCGSEIILDMEWSKKLIKSVVILAKKDCTLNFEFQKSIKSFRFRSNLKSKGTRIDSGQPISFELGKKYILDNFHK